MAEKWGFSMEMDVWGKVLAFSALCIFCVVASVWDLKWRRIPNWFVIAGLVTGLFLHLLTVMVDSGIWVALADSALGFFTGGLPWLLADLFGRFWSGGKSCIGGGDIKFYAVCGVFLGINKVLVSYCVLAVLSMLILGVLCLFQKLKRGDRIPFGPLIGAAAVIAEMVCW